MRNGGVPKVIACVRDGVNASLRRGEIVRMVGWRGGNPLRGAGSYKASRSPVPATLCARQLTLYFGCLCTTISHDAARALYLGRV